MAAQLRCNVTSNSVVIKKEVQIIGARARSLSSYPYLQSTARPLPIHEQ